MAQTPQDDFDKKYGGGTATATAPAATASDDFDKKYGNASAKPSPTTADNEVERAGANSFATKHPIITGAARGITTLGGMLPESTHASDYSVAPGAWQMLRHPIESAKLLNEGMVQPMLTAGQGRYDKMFQAADVAKKDWQTGHPVKAANAAVNAATYGAEGTVPVLGPWVGSLADELGHGIENRNTPEGKEEIAHAITSPLAAGMVSNLGSKGSPTEEAVANVTRPVGTKAGQAVAGAEEAVGKKIYDPGTAENPPSGELRPWARGTARVGGAVAGGFAGGELGPLVIPGTGETLGRVYGAYKGWKGEPEWLQSAVEEPGEFQSKRAQFDLGQKLRESMGQPSTAPKPTPSEMREQLFGNKTPFGSAETIPQPNEIPTPSAGGTTRDITDMLNKAYNVEPLKPNVPLREQMGNAPAPKLEPTPTPTEPAAEAPKRTSAHHVYGDEVGEELRSKPDLQSYFNGKRGEGFTNVKARQALIHAGEDMGQQVVNSKMLQGEGAIKPGDAVRILRDKGYTMEQIRDLAEKPAK